MLDPSAVRRRQRGRRSGPRASACSCSGTGRRPSEVPIAGGDGGHGGGDALLLSDLFVGPGDDPLGRPADWRDGVQLDRGRHRRQPLARVPVESPVGRGSPISASASSSGSDAMTVTDEPHRRHRRRRPPRPHPRRRPRRAPGTSSSRSTAVSGCPSSPTSSRSRWISPTRMPRPAPSRRPGPTRVIHLAAIAVPFSAPEDVILRTNATLALHVLASAVAAGIPKIVAASSPTVLGYGAPTGWLPERFPLDEEHAAAAVERLRALEAASSSRPSRCSPRQTGDADPLRGVPALLRDRPRGVGGRADPAGPHRRASGSTTRRCRRRRLFNYVDARDVATFVDALLDALPAHPERRGVLRRAPTTPSPASRSPSCCRGSCPAPRTLAAGAHRHVARLLQRQGAAAAGLAPRPRLARRARPTACPSTADRTDAPAWTSTASSSSR